MSRPKSDRGITVQGYCRKHRKMSTTDLARLLMAENKDMFDDLEQVRSLVRAYRGTNGNKMRADMVDTDCFVGGASLAASRGKFAPKILIFDIETTPSLAYVWRMYKENISPGQVVKNGDLLCWSAKWLGEKEVMQDSVRNDKNDKRCCKTLWKLFDEADAVVAHNGIAFDTRYMSSRWAFHKIPPPSPYKQVDTLKLAKGLFRFESNKLDYIARYLGIGRKVPHTGFDMWVGCMKGEKKSWDMMLKYNVQDTLLLEEVYLRLRSWDIKHPNVGMMYDDEEARCIVCGSTHVKEIHKSVTSSACQYPSLRCMNCGKVMRSRKADPKKKTFAHAL